MSEAKEPRTEAGKRMDIWSSGKVPIRDLGFDSARDAILAIEDQATAEADLRLLVMTTARDAAVKEADRLREAATEARRELLAKVEGLHAEPGRGVQAGTWTVNRADMRRLIEESHD